MIITTRRHADEICRDLFQDAARLIEYPFVWDSQNPNALLDHVCITIPIMVPLLISLVHSTIALNCQAGFATIKVRDVITELMLSSEFEAHQSTISKQLPEENLRRCLFLPQFPRELY